MLTKLKLLKNKITKLTTLLLTLIIILSIALIYTFYSAPEETATDDCNVSGIELRGQIYTYVPLDHEGKKLEGYEDTTTSEDVLYLLDQAKYSDDIKAVLIEVDSYGGSPSAAEEIANAIANLNKPVVAFIREIGASAAYYSITPADYIFALKNSEVGSIGVTQSYLDNVIKNKNEGYSFVQLNTGKFKDAGDPNKPITQEERDLFMRDLKIVHDNFVETISTFRNLDLEKVRKMADGSTVLGEQAKELGLIDEIGDYNSAVRYLKDLMGEWPEVCW